MPSPHSFDNLPVADRKRILHAVAIKCGIVHPDAETLFDPTHGFAVPIYSDWWNPGRNIEQALKLAYALGISIRTIHYSETTGHVRVETPSTDANGMHQIVNGRTEGFYSTEEQELVVCKLVTLAAYTYEGKSVVPSYHKA